MKNFLLIVLIVTLLCLLIRLYCWSQFTIETTYYSFEGPKDLTIVQLSDLHNNKFGKNQEKIIKRINKTNPDVIALTGDMIGHNTSEHFDRLIKELRSKFPKTKIFFVTGNHETYGIRDNLEKYLNANGVILLDDNGFHYSRQIDFYGIGDRSTYKEGLIENNNKFKILLIHRPDFVDKYINKYDLILAGHMHGGQWRFPFFKEGLVSPEKTLFPKRTGGLYIMPNNTKLIISRGLGTLTWIPRIFNRPEIVIVDIKKSKC